MSSSIQISFQGIEKINYTLWRFIRNKIKTKIVLLDLLSFEQLNAKFIVIKNSFFSLIFSFNISLSCVFLFLLN